MGVSDGWRLSRRSHKYVILRATMTGQSQNCPHGEFKMTYITLPSQLCPSPVKPSEQVQIYEPIKFTQVEFLWQKSPSHSFISEGFNIVMLLVGTICTEY
jgi:hypothetical protein